MISANHFHWTFVWIPILGAFIWFSTLLAMLLTWACTGKPHYVSEEGNIPYISDIGADILKPLFIVGCSITAVCFFLSLFIERWLRHSGRLMPNMRTRERVFGSLAVLGAFIGGAGVILLSIFDTKRHTSLHRLFLLIFMLGVALSALFSVIEYRWISKEFHYVRTLRIGYLAKAIIAGILIVLSIAFGIALYKSTEVGAVLEWTISFGFTLYLLTFYYDLRQSKGVPRGELTAEKMTRRRRLGRWTLTNN
ncbi:Frag1/DRAM/Sfk1 [Mycena floridula]|nr:Frag1/DRAM/Sfk1 [Mycena floridula]